MFESLANHALRRPWRILVCAVLFGIVAGLFGGPVAGLMTNGSDDFEDPASQSIEARELLAEASEAKPDADVVALVRTEEGVRTPEARAKVERVAQKIADDPSVAQVLTAYETRNPAMISKDGQATFVLASFGPDQQTDQAAQRLQDELRASDPDVTLGGEAIVGPQISEVIGEDLARAELLAFPLLLLLSLWIFRGLVAAVLPLLVGGLSIVGTLLGMRMVTEITPLSVFALNLVTGLGLGLAIDYSLFIISRYREELSRLGPGPEALRRTLATAGRTVLFSSLTVAVALSALLVFPQRFLYSMGVGGMFVTMLAAAVSLVVLPAVLALLGTRINALSLNRWRRSADAGASPVEHGGWYKLSHFVMARPATMAAAAAVLLITMGAPFLGVKFTQVDASVLPEDASARQVDDAFKTEFPASSNVAPLYLAVAAPDDAAARERLDDYSAALGELPNVKSVAPPRAVGEGFWQVDVVPETPTFSDESRDLVDDVRALDGPFPVQVGGETARFVDLQASLVDHLPLALAIVFGATFVLLFLMTGSVVLPLKAILMNMLTISATFGVLVWIFQDGRLEGLLDYRSQGALESTQPILIMIVAFGLSTDYGVFLLSRIKEARDSGLDDREAVAVGVGRTGRIVTAAALLFCVALGAFATSQIVFIKELGIGAALAVVVDATVVRAFLVPSLMSLLGSRNWWAPKPLRKVYERIGLKEGEQEDLGEVVLGHEREPKVST